MKNTLLVLAIILAFTTSCQKSIEITTPAPHIPEPVKQQPATFTKYTILQGQQYCDLNLLTKVEYQEMKFVVKFDSTAIYQTQSPANQADINKLFGFSDNNAQHHQYSARFGWNWNIEGGLQLFGYVYNNGVRSSKFLGKVDIGKEHNCAIKVAGSDYIFILNGSSFTMPRSAPISKAMGYKLYPYFGGDEVAPHTISIWIKEL